MPLTQAHRFTAIETPLGKDVLVLKRFSFREQLGRLFEMELELISEDHKIDFDKIVGENVTVRLETVEKQTRYFNGHVSRFAQGPPQGKYARYNATVVPWLWFLTRTADCRIFQKSMPEPPDKMTAPGIIKKAFKDLGFVDVRDDGLTQTYREWEYCVQYRETNFNFVSRLMEQEGIYYFFEHENGKHTLVLADSLSAHEPFPLYETIFFRPPGQPGTSKGDIVEWAIEKQVQPGAYLLNDFNFEKPKKAFDNSLLAKATVERDYPESKFEMFDYPGEYLEHDEGEDCARIRIEELQAQYEVLRGRATARGLSAGYLFNLADHPRPDQKRLYLVTAVGLEVTSDVSESSAHGGGDSFECSFSAIYSKEPFRSPRLTAKPIVQGPQNAIVVGPKGDEIHTDKYGRVKVQFPWDRYGQGDENSSCWVRVSQLWAGKKWGAIYIPRIGQEVIVEFMEGDPDAPIITGRVYNGDSMPPYDLPANATMSTLKSNSSKGGQGFNEIRFEDKKGEERVFIHGEKDEDIRIKNDAKEWIGNNLHLVVKNDKLDHVENNRNEKIGNDHKEEIGGARHLKITGLEAKEVGGNFSLTVKGNVSEVFKANHSEETTGNFYLKANGTVVIESPQGITLKCGGNNIVIDASGVTLKGSMVTVDGSMVKIASGPGSPAGSGSAGSADAPEAPVVAEDAAVADPGEMADFAAKQAQLRGVAPGSKEVAGTEEEAESAVDEKTSWISIELRDADGRPVPNERYKIKLPDGSFREGSLNSDGKARVAGIKPGTCQVSFPEIDADEWRPA